MKSNVMQVCALAVVGIVGACRGRAEPVSELSGLVDRWVQLQSQIAREEVALRERRVRWQRETTLLEQEKVRLADELEALAAQTGDRDASDSDPAAARDALRAELLALAPTVTEAERAAQAFEPLIPDAVAPELLAALRRLPGRPSKDADDAAAVVERLQALLSFHAGLEALQKQVHAVRRMVTVDGRPREADVLYIGLARAFAVTADGTWAAVAVPGPAGWSWRTEPSLAGAVQAALAVFRRERPASLVPLPLATVHVPLPERSEP